MSPDRRLFILVRESSKSIVRFLERHPIDWGDLDQRCFGGPADRLGYPPTYAMAEFAAVYNDRERIPTQQEYVDWCYGAWAAWLSLKTPPEREAYRHKLIGNFYPAAIDALHVTALLTECGDYDQVRISTDDDARLGVDVTVRVGDRSVRIDLKGVQTRHAKLTAVYRAERRPIRPGVVWIELPGDSPKSPGNKRWYTLELLRRHIDPFLFMGAA